MLSIISPAKKLNLDYNYKGKVSEISFPQQTKDLITILKQKSASDLSLMMSLSAKLAEVNVARYDNFNPDVYDASSSTPAVFLFQGDVYKHLDPATLTANEIVRLQCQVGILSGLYGLLRPLDLIQPYRLEMGTSIANAAGNNLYDLWRPKIAGLINERLQQTKTKYLINLASQEYFAAIDTSLIDGVIIKVEFKDKKGDQYRTIGINAKRARGAMVRYIVQHNCMVPDDLAGFNCLGYAYSADLSSTASMVFLKG